MFDIANDKFLGLDGFSVEFFKNNWPLLGFRGPTGAIVFLNRLSPWGMEKNIVGTHTKIVIPRLWASLFS